MTDPRAAIRAAFDTRAASHDDHAMHQALAVAVASFAPLDGVVDVLDVATGTGLVLRALDARHPDGGLRLTGVDLSPGMLAVARAALPGAAFVEADAAALPFGDASVDLVTCVTALHLMPELDAVLTGWRRVLRPDGRAIIATFAESEDGAAPVGHGQPSADRPYAVDHSPFASPAAVAETAGRHGFTLERHAFWRHDHDRILLADLRPAP